MGSGAEYEADVSAPSLNKIWQKYSDALFSTPAYAPSFADKYRYFIVASLATIEASLPNDVQHLPDAVTARTLNAIIYDQQTIAFEKGMPGAVAELRKSSSDWHQYIVGTIHSRIGFRDTAPVSYQELVYGLESGKYWYTARVRHIAD